MLRSQERVFLRLLSFVSVPLVSSISCGFWVEKDTCDSGLISGPLG